MNNVDKQYIELCKHILENGVKKQDRFEDFEIVGYEPHPHIKGEVAV